MNELQELLKARLSPKIKPKKMQSWQIEALEAVEYFIDGKAKLSSIMRCFKFKHDKAKIAFLDCKELEKKKTAYFFKLFYILNKKI